MSEVKLKTDGATGKKVVAQVDYQVGAVCPHCGDWLDLTARPYEVDDEYGHGEDLLGLAVFGTKDEPAKWEGLDIEYTCCMCHQSFTVVGLEI